MSYDEAIFQMYLGEVPMFQACSEEELSAVAYLASPRALEAGSEKAELSFEQRFQKIDGTVGLGHTQGGLRNARLSGFGELALFDPAPRNATITADVPVIMAVMEHSRFQAALTPSRHT
jgi:hypothetical protein